jgi:hypothetical protein
MILIDYIISYFILCLLKIMNDLNILVIYIRIIVGLIIGMFVIL